MGSSRKHKERDRDREHKHSHRKHRKSRSRSRDRDHKSDKTSRRRKHRHEHGRDDENGREEKRRRMPSASSSDDDVSTQSKAVPPMNVAKPKPLGPTAPETDIRSGDGSSLSIGDTNKLRVKLGLKPLSVGGPDTAGGEKSGKREDVHVPAVNLASIRRTEELREKMAQIKEKRRINKLLGKVKSTLGESDSDNDDALKWINRSRHLEEAQGKQREQDKILAEMDQEFGVSNLIDQEFGLKKDYTSRDLRGLQVQHDQSTFNEGQTVILTLQDKGVLDEETDDMLVNVNMVDDERAVKNVSNKTKGISYKAYDEPEYDEFGMLKHKDVLDKYDEEIHGEVTQSFKLDAKGRYNAAREQRMRDIQTTARQAGQSLSLPPPVLATEFFSPAEMEGFKKVKKKVRKIRKQKMMSVNDLLPVAGASQAGDFGRRAGAQDRAEAPVGVNDPTAADIPGLDIVDMDEVDPENDCFGPAEDLSSVRIDGETGQEAASIVAKATKLRTARHVTVAADKLLAQRVALVAKSAVEEEPSADADRNTIQMNSISEFCRALGEIPTYGMAGNRQYGEEDLLDFERSGAGGEGRGGGAADESSDDEQAPGWQAVQPDMAAPTITDEAPVVLQEEPVVNEGLAVALELARQKGFLDDTDDSWKPAGASSGSTDLRAQNYSIEDKRYDDLDEKSRKRDRYSGAGMVQDFQEKEGYRPAVKIEYVDDNGYLMSSKEAFRYLSHRFHGKGSGKKKTEKRTKKIEMEQLMKATSSTDTPLGTSTLLHEKQKAEKTPYVLLSGAGAKVSSAGPLAK